MPKIVKPVLYPQTVVSVCVGEQALTSTKAKELLGWEAETGEVKFGEDYLLKDEEGRKIRCSNNSRNRPFNEQHCRRLAQDILNLNWRFNHETIIIGKHGSVLSGQHRLMGLVLAGQIWAGPQSEHWRAKWATEPSIEVLVSFGCEEDNEVTRTLDNVRPRSLGDVLHTMDVFSSMGKKDRAAAVKILDHATRFLWDRTGAGNDPYSPQRSHSESLNLIDAHPRLLKAVEHILQEDQAPADNKSGRTKQVISSYFSPGYAAGYLYLMGASGTNTDEYLQTRNESCIPFDRVEADAKGNEFTRWDRAEEFWVLFGGNTDLKELRYAITELCNPDTGVDNGSQAEKRALIAKAWNEFVQGNSVTGNNLRLEYEVIEMDADGNILERKLTETPVVGGIDIADIAGQEEEAVGQEEQTPAPPTPEELELQKAKERQARIDANKAKLKAAKEAAAAKKNGSKLDELAATAKKNAKKDKSAVKP